SGTQQSAEMGGRKPLVVIRFDQANVPYQQPLYDAVNKALQRKPSVSFDLVAVAASGNDAGEGALKASEAARQADSVVRTMVAMGLPRDRITVTPSTSADVSTNEIDIYVR